MLRKYVIKSIHWTSTQLARTWLHRMMTCNLSHWARVICFVNEWAVGWVEELEEDGGVDSDHREQMAKPIVRAISFRRISANLALAPKFTVKMALSKCQWHCLQLAWFDTHHNNWTLRRSFTACLSLHLELTFQPRLLKTCYSSPWTVGMASSQ